MEWVDKLVDDIDDLLVNDKSVKFNTHKNRKRIMGTIRSLVKASIASNLEGSAEPKETPHDNQVRIREGVITRPNPNSSRGFAVLTESDSSKNDEIHKEHVPGSHFDKEAVKRNNAGMRKW